MRVIAATKNKSEPHGRRPYHRPDCWQVTRNATTRGQGTGDNWTFYPNCAAAQADRRRPCNWCNPAD